jgi:hypothetical protein
MDTKKIVFYTLVSDNFYYPCNVQAMINSFKRFHPDIDLVVFRQDMIDKVFKEKNLNFYMAKPTFAKILTPHYDLVVNIDSDHIVLDRCEEILKGDYDIGCPINKNDYENTSVENITEDMFLQGGMVASTKKEFWEIWEKENKKAMDYKCKENDIMNLVIYNNPIVKKMKLKIFDKDKDYYGCKSLGREEEFYMKNGRVYCRREQVYLYHVARGGIQKPRPKQLGFSSEVVDYMNAVSNYGKTVIYGQI